MVKVFISLPIAGLPEEKIDKNRKKAIEEISTILNNKEVEIINSWIEEEPPGCIKGDKRGLWYIGKSLEKLAEADILYCAKGWETFRGCVMEHKAADFYGIRIFTHTQYLFETTYQCNKNEN